MTICKKKSLELPILSALFRLKTPFDLSKLTRYFPPPLAPAQPSPGSCHPLVRAQAKQWQTENQAFKAFKLVFYASEAYPRDLQYWIAKLVKNKPDTNKIMSSRWFLLWLISLVQWQMR